MTDSFPQFQDRSLDETSTGLTQGDEYYTGDSLVSWVQPDPNDEGGYWESTELSRPSRLFDQILARLTAIEVALGIDPADP